MDAVSLAALCAAMARQGITLAGGPVQKNRIAKWISLQQFIPIDQPETGKVRSWGIQDVARLIAFVRLIDAGCEIEVGTCIGRVLGGFPVEGRRFLVVTAYDRPLVKASRNELAELPHGWARVVDEMSLGKRHRAFPCKASEVLEHLKRGLGVIAIFVLDLDEIQKLAERVMKSAQRINTVKCERRSFRRRSKPIAKATAKRISAPPGAQFTQSSS
jgi:hypothetical protein